MNERESESNEDVVQVSPFDLVERLLKELSVMTQRALVAEAALAATQEKLTQGSTATKEAAEQ